VASLSMLKREGKFFPSAGKKKSIPTEPPKELSAEGKDTRKGGGLGKKNALAIYGDSFVKFERGEGKQESHSSEKKPEKGEK